MISNIENTLLFLANIVALWALYYYRSPWALYIIIAICSFQICTQLLSMQMEITNIATSLISIILFKIFNFLFSALPTVYLVAEGLAILKALKNNENGSNNAGILDAK